MSEAEAGADERWMVIGGRRWRRTDPALPGEVVEALKSQLGRGRSGVRVAKAAGDDAAVAVARQRVGLAKLGLGERGPEWWHREVSERLRQAQDALEELARIEQHE